MMNERTIPENFTSKEEYLLYLRQLFVYKSIKRLLSNKNFALEIGCGEGYGANILSKYFKRVIALDVDKAVIANAAKKYFLKNCIFQVYDGKKIPYENKVFDVVISFQVIEHLVDSVSFVLETYRVLKKNGIFLITTPNRNYRLKPNQKP